MMIKLIFTFLVISSYCLLGNNEAVKLDSVNYPNEVILSKDIKSCKDAKIVIKYDYLGKRLLPVTNEYGRYSCSVSYSMEGSILYLTEGGDCLPRAYNYYNGRALDSFFPAEIRSSLTSGPDIFKRDRPQEIEFHLFDPFLHLRKDDTELFEFIQSAQLAGILVVIKSIEISWELKYSFYQEEKEEKKGKFILNINKEFRVNVKYGNKANLLKSK